MAGICLTLGKRREIERLYNDDMRPSEIAAAVWRMITTIYRKLKRGETGELDSTSARHTRRRQRNGQYGSLSETEAGESRGKRSKRGALIP